MKRRSKTFSYIIILITFIIFTARNRWGPHKEYYTANQLDTVRYSEFSFDVEDGNRSKINDPNLLYNYVSAYAFEGSQSYPFTKPDSCPIYYGKARIDYWKSQKTSLCQAPKENTNSSPVIGKPLPPSQIDCHHVIYKSNDPRPENLCVVKNLALDVSKFLQTRSISRNPYGYPPHGSFRVSQCQLNTTLFRADRFGEAGGSLFFQGLSPNGKSNIFYTVDDSTIMCDATIDHTIFLVSRWDTTNIYHAHEEFFQTFAAYAVTDLDLEDTEIWLADNAQRKGTFQIFWERVFTGSAHQHPKIKKRPRFRDDDPSQMLVKHIRDVVQDLHAKGKRTLCFSKIAFNVFAGISSLSRDIGKYQSPPCKYGETSLIFGFRAFLFDRFGFLPDKDMAPLSDARAIRIVISSRRANFQRQLRHEDVLIEKLRKDFCNAWIQETPRNSQFLPTGYECHLSLRLVDFAELHIYDQLKLMRETDLLIGAHGCALTLAMYMPLWSGIVEFWHPSRFANYHFARIARFLGLFWQSIPIDSYENEPKKGMLDNASSFVEAVKIVREFVPQILAKREAILKGTYIPTVS